MNKLREARKIKGLTLKEVAEDVGIADNTLHQYETEKREPKKETWIKLADYYCVPVAYLMGLPSGLVEYIDQLGYLNFDLLDCLNSAYRVIQNRKGKTINGVFVKETDLHK